MKQSNLVTVITPTYNRKELLKKLYESLLHQTDFGFQWIVVDDGSTDGTSEWMGGLNMQSIPFALRYLKKENGGKHRALNYAHPYIDGDVVTVVDSDDVLTSNAIAAIRNKWNQYKDKGVSLMIFQRGTMEGEHQPFDKSFPGEDLVTSLAYLTNHGMHGDHCEVAKKEAFLKYSLPEYDGERFMGEAWLWQNIGCEGKTVFTNEVIYLCEYLEGGLTKSGRAMRLRNPFGGMEHARIFLNKNYSMSIRVKNAILYVCYGRVAGKSYSEIINGSGHKLVVIAAMLPGIGLYKYWTKQ